MSNPDSVRVKKLKFQNSNKGLCAFPKISMDPAVIFDRRVRKAAPKNNEIIQKKYIVPQKMFQFGPLLVGRTRDKTKPFKHVENFDKIWISNDGYLPAEISLSFRKESSNPIFSLETQKMSLQLG